MAPHLASLLATFLVAACGTVTTTTLDVKSDEKYVFDLQDHRPSVERRGERTTEYGNTLTRLGDENISPAGPVLLRTWLHRKGPASIEARRIVLTEFAVTVFEPAVHVPAGMAAAGLLGLIGGHGIEAVRSYKVVSVRVTGTVDGEEFQGFASDRFRGRVQHADINKVIERALDHTVERIAAALEPKKTAATL